MALALQKELQKSQSSTYTSSTNSTCVTPRKNNQKKFQVHTTIVDPSTSSSKLPVSTKRKYESSPIDLTTSPPMHKQIKKIDKCALIDLTNNTPSPEQPYSYTSSSSSTSSSTK